jgi:hypothetical protein
MTNCASRFELHDLSSLISRTGITELIGRQDSQKVLGAQLSTRVVRRIGGYVHHTSIQII